MSQRKIKVRLKKKKKEPRTRPLSARDMMILMHQNRKLQEAQRQMQELKAQAERIENKLEEGGANGEGER